IYGGRKKCCTWIWPLLWVNWWDWWVPLNYFRVVEGPYPFLKVHNQPWYMSILWFFAISLVAFGIAVLLRKVCGKRGDRK
ncbi:MAG: hypothetical protein J6S83_02220, partial [Lachnospiraceae bacterium]|nr:hypothetical protein [Lachnospiraceae bacterium]